MSIRDAITLDPQIRYWVIAPILVITFLFGLIRHYLTLILKNGPTQGSPEQVKTMQLIRKYVQFLYDSYNMSLKYKICLDQTCYEKMDIFYLKIVIISESNI